jgi:hypothetical protein
MRPMSRSRIRTAAWLAALAIALNALWPLVAQAKPHAAGELVAVCTVEGTTHYIELPAGKAPLDEQSAKHQDHCAFCVFGSDRAAPPTQLQPAPPASSTDASPPPMAAGLQLTRNRSVSPGSPRAPPAAS